MGEKLDEFELKLKEILIIRSNISLTAEQKEEQEDYIWKVINKIWKGMGPIETKYSEEIMDKLFPWTTSNPGILEG